MLTAARVAFGAVAVAVSLAAPASANHVACTPEVGIVCDTLDATNRLCRHPYYVCH